MGKCPVPITGRQGAEKIYQGYQIINVIRKYGLVHCGFTLRVFLFLVLFIGLQIAWGLIFPLDVYVWAEEEPCLKCHKTVATGTVKHAAIDIGCSSCHASPHEREVPELSLVTKQPDLCFGCHDRSMF